MRFLRLPSPTRLGAGGTEQLEARAKSTYDPPTLACQLLQNRRHADATGGPQQR